MEYNSKLILATLFFLQTQNIASSYKCDVPDSWLIDTNNTLANRSFMPGTKWPGAVVKYQLHSSLSAADRSEVQKAFDEYHRKTCIRFVQRSPNEAAYTSIEVDPNVCGLGHMCRLGGYQFAKFGGGCRKADVMIHELGHNLCMGHEQSRPDRDDYVHFNGCPANEVPGKNTNYNTLDSLYDYTSQMHYACNWCLGGWPKMSGVTRCGSTVTPGLSVLDADKLNAFYDCGGCFSHRFKNFQKLTTGDINTLLQGGNDPNVPGTTYVCRAYHKGDVLPGAFNLGTRTCYLAEGGREHAYRSGDVLTNPRNVNMRWIRKSGNLPANVVPAGRMKNGETVYVGRCNVSSNGRVALLVGKVHANNHNNLYVSHNGQEIICTTFDILVCN